MSGLYYKLILEYDGSEFSGWQVQKNTRTVQGELEKALGSLFQEQIRVTASGRTDAGVHALGQVVSFSATRPRGCDEIRLGLNSLLPGDITVISAEVLSAPFNARFDARRRCYQYRIFRGASAIQRKFAWCLKEPLNTHDMQRCADVIQKESDFQSFCSSSVKANHYLCQIDQAIWHHQTPDLLVFQICANRFLHNMVRILVGTMVEVGRGRFSVADFQQMFQKKNRTIAGLTAPACGLFLVRVEYG